MNKQYSLSAILSSSHLRDIEFGNNIPALLHGTASRPPDLPSESSYILLPLTARIGLPLLFRVLPADDAQKQRTETWVAGNGGIEDAENPVLRLLSMGRPGSCEKSSRPCIVILRADGKKIEMEQVLQLCSFVTWKLHTHESTFNADMTPENFVKYWDSRPWMGKAPVCPVALGCKGCEKEARLRCAKCGVVRYCNGACQKADWASHKKVGIKA